MSRFNLFSMAGLPFKAFPFCRFKVNYRGFLRDTLWYPSIDP